MTDVVHPHKINRAVCEALGLNASKVLAVTIEFSYGTPIVTVKHILTDVGAKVITEALRGYTLVDKDDQEAGAK